MSRMHQRDLHLLFVISLHSSAQALREILPRSKMEQLRIEPFKLEPSVQLLKRIVSEVRQGTWRGVARRARVPGLMRLRRQVLVSGLLPVRFSGAVLREINCNFHTWNLSVWRYVRCIQVPPCAARALTYSVPLAAHPGLLLAAPQRVLHAACDPPGVR